MWGTASSLSGSDPAYLVLGDRAGVPIQGFFILFVPWEHICKQVLAGRNTRHLIVLLQNMLVLGMASHCTECMIPLPPILQYGMLAQIRPTNTNTLQNFLQSVVLTDNNFS